MEIDIKMSFNMNEVELLSTHDHEESANLTLHNPQLNGKIQHEICTHVGLHVPIIFSSQESISPR